jgi:hypothetical protein
MPISDVLLSVLACPQCKKELTYDRAADKLICPACGLRFSIVDGVPNMMVEEAERFDPR